MKKLANYEQKLLACVAEKWAAFYQNAPKEFGQVYIEKACYTRAEFLELAAATQFFDYAFYEQNPAHVVYKDLENIPSDCKSWFLNEKELELYHATPEKFTQDEFRAKRLAMNLPVNSQDKTAGGTLFKKHIPVTGERYYDIEKGLIKPALK